MKLNTKLCLILMCLYLCTHISFSQQEQQYVLETDPLVIQKLNQYQDAKFGLLMHWGIYSQWGIVESWTLCAEDEDWCKRTGPYAADYESYKKAYRDLKKTMNPIKFNPEQWAKAAKEAGMKYLVFTTKHHDGFCMFDTKTTDFKITSDSCAFHTNPRANITKSLFDAFRKEGLMVGAYYSKPDWNSDYYWWQYFPTPDRHVNYDPAKYPERWQQFKDYTYTQIEELMTNYGSVDILWLDGAWVRPFSNMPAEYESWGKKKNYNQDIDIPRIATMARSHQPGLIVVDRWVSGKYENYLTPEKKVPEKALNVPWESCIPMATSWSYVPNDTYKPARELIQLLVDVVAKGGNLLLNIGPTPEGELPPESLERLKDIGGWMNINNNAIYNTKPVAPYKEKNICFTKLPDGTINAIYLADEKEQRPPETITLSSFAPKAGGKIMMLGVSDPLQWEPNGDGCIIHIPDSVRSHPPCQYAWTFQLKD